MLLYYKNKARGDIFKEKGISEQFFKIKNPPMIQLNRIQLTSQTPNHVEITKILSTSQRESSIVLLTASTKLEDWILIYVNCSLMQSTRETGN